MPAASSSRHTKWIQQARIDWDAASSPVIVVQTNDPRRREEFLAYLADPAAKACQTVYRLDGWRGLQQRDARSGRFQAPRAAAYPGRELQEEELRSIGYALRELEAQFISQRGTAVLIWDCEVMEESQIALLRRALRVWSHDETLLQQHVLIALFAANPTRIIDEETLDLACFIQPPLASEDERLQIVSKLAGDTDGNRQRQIASAAAGLNLHQTEAVLRRSLSTMDACDPALVFQYKADLVRRSDVLDLQTPEHGFDEIGGYQDVKDLIRNRFIALLNEPLRAQELATRLPHGLLLYGPPGTGKTIFARALAFETKLPFVHLRTENIFRHFLGQSGQRLKNAFQLAEALAPAIIFIDEIERFGSKGSREATGDGASVESGRLFNQMLEYLGNEGRKTIIVGTTNRPDVLDPAFVRPGRIDMQIDCPLPDEPARLEILRVHLGLVGRRRAPRMNREEVEKILPEIARATRDCSGADLELLIDTAKAMAFTAGARELDPRYLCDALAQDRKTPAG